MSSPLLIIGASVRAAAFSAQAAGLEPLCADLFADVDLTRRCSAVAVRPYPEGLLDVVSRMPEGPFMVTGALENYPEFIAQLASQRTLYGNSAEVLRPVRDPFRLAEVLAEIDVPMPELRRDGSQLPRDGRWMVKPFRGSGGGRVAAWTEALVRSEAFSDPNQNLRDFYFQRRQEGTPCAAVYVASQGRATLLGVSRQIIGESWTGADGFRYAGSVGPLTLSESVQNTFEKIGNQLAEQFGLVGIFGVDAILARGKSGEKSKEAVLPLEVNPRYPASAEVLERATQHNAVSLHVAACRDELLPEVLSSESSSVCGKAIVFATEDLVVPAQFTAWADEQNDVADQYVLADLPAAGTEIPAGAPIATVLADGKDSLVVERRLRRRAEALQCVMAAEPLRAGEVAAELNSRE